ncbi:MAG: hypothetical protein ABI216_12550, partial [Devosia sp.]
MPIDPKPFVKPSADDQGRVTSVMESLDPDDPHPAEEGDPYNTRDSGGVAKGPTPDIGPNPSKHDGAAPPRPHNVENDPQ